MNVAKKLEEFSKTAINEAERTGASIIRKLEENYEAECERIDKAAQEEAEAEIEAERRELRRKRDKALLEAKTSIRRRLSAQREVLTDRLFYEAEKMLEDYTSSDEYFKALKSGISDFCEAHANALIYVSANDAARLIKEADPALKNVVEGGSRMIGGFKAVIPDKSVSFDNSYYALLQGIRTDFNFRAEVSE
jgi:vacuolar-type H+-ATPase subunit E/Vma4